MTVDKSHLEGLRIDRGDDSRAERKPLWTILGIAAFIILAGIIWLVARPSRA